VRRSIRPIRILGAVVVGVVFICAGSISASADPPSASPPHDPTSIARLSPMLSLSAEHTERQAETSRRVADLVLGGISGTTWEADLRWFVLTDETRHAGQPAPSICIKAQRAPPPDR
jgi:hypothetical protein